MSFEEAILKIKDEKEKETMRLLEEEKGKEKKSQFQAPITEDIIQKEAGKNAKEEKEKE